MLIARGRHEIGLQMQGPAVVETSYISLVRAYLLSPSRELNPLTAGPFPLERPFSLIKIKVQPLRDYVAKWLQFQSLEAEYVFNRLEGDLASWP